MLEHFKAADQGFIVKVRDWINQVYDKQQIKVTQFLNPHEQDVLKSFVNRQQGLKVFFVGGFLNAERQRAIIFPNQMNPKNLDKKVNGFQIIYHQKLMLPSHRQILGSLMALKIERSVIGDIVVLNDSELYFAVCDEFSSFMIENFTKVGRDSVFLEQTNLQRLEKNDRYEELEIIVSSMRLDVVVASLINASRSIVFDLMNQGFVQLNHLVTKNHSLACHTGDLISIKGYGRFKLMAQKKITKKQKLVIVVGKAI